MVPRFCRLKNTRGILRVLERHAQVAIISPDLKVLITTSTNSPRWGYRKTVERSKSKQQKGRKVEVGIWICCGGKKRSNFCRQHNTKEGTQVGRVGGRPSRKKGKNRSTAWSRRGDKKSNFGDTSGRKKIFKGTACSLLLEKRRGHLASSSREKKKTVPIRTMWCWRGKGGGTVPKYSWFSSRESQICYVQEFFKRLLLTEEKSENGPIAAGLVRQNRGLQGSMKMSIERYIVTTKEVHVGRKRRKQTGISGRERKSRRRHDPEGFLAR